MKKILILGSEGFIGSNCVIYFENLQFDISGCDILHNSTRSYRYFRIDQRNPDYNSIFLNNKFDYCINAAGNGSVPKSIINPVADFYDHAVNTHNLLDSLRNHCPDIRFLNISSAAVYGNPDSIPISEKNTVHPISPYGWHKYLSELICKEFAVLYQMKTVSVRPFSVYGPGIRKQLFWDLYQKITNSVSQQIYLYGSGNESRDFIYITDLLQQIHLILLNAEFAGEVVNAANGKQWQIRNAVHSFIEKYGWIGEVIFTENVRKGDPLNWEADIRQIKALGYTQKISFEQGIQNYISWLRENILD
jgi:dTDP-glucose 4,6-dehydratase/UDP-glucose 4-epimerase